MRFFESKSSAMILKFVDRMPKAKILGTSEKLLSKFFIVKYFSYYKLTYKWS